MFSLILEFFRKIFFFTGSFLTGGSFKKPLTKEEETHYLALAEQGDKNAKEILMERNMRLVAHVVKKYKGADETDDLISVGSLGLYKAVNTYKADKGTAFGTFAARCIENEILMLLRANKKHKNTVSLWDDIGTDKDGNALQIIDLLTEEEDSVFKNANDKILQTALIKKMRETLTEREFLIISLRFGIGNGECYAQREVAKKLKISRSYVSRIEKKAIEKLRLTINKDNFIY